MRNHPISWTAFEACNANTQEAFEYMCGSLFRRMFTVDGTVLHYNPQNPGIECEPTIEKDTGKRISFQAKYFGAQIGYSKLEDSTEKTVKYYAGRIDKVFLYCNKDLYISGVQYQRIKKRLNDSGIELETVTNRAILDVVPDYPQIAACYFNAFSLTPEWFKAKHEKSLAELGRRYNGKFNICTETEHELDLFFQNNDAVSAINQKKEKAIDELRSNQWRCSEYRPAVARAIDFLMDLPEVNKYTLSDSMRWAELLRGCIADELASARDRLSIAERDYYEKHDSESRELYTNLKWFVSIPNLLQFSSTEERLLNDRILVLTGQAGTGKSHLLANTVKKSLLIGDPCILLLGQGFSSDEPVSVQIPQQLSLDTDLEDLFAVLNEIGVRTNRSITICIDALNESGNKRIWKTGLPGIIKSLEQFEKIRLIISYRTGYENLVLGDSVRDWLNSGKILSLFHEGFRDESIDAVQDFLNHYGIPFSPEYYLQHEMTNPLFLTLFCETYDGSIVDIATLIDRIIEKADHEAQNSIGLDRDMPLLKHFLKELSEKRINSDYHGISKQDVLNLPFWERYGLSNNKIQYISGLVKFGILSDFAIHDDEYYYIGFNLLEDYLCAREIINAELTKEETIQFIRDKVLCINGDDYNSFNTGMFVAVSALFAEKYGEECIQIIDEIDDKYARYQLEKEYVESFAWRKACGINKDAFLSILDTRRIDADTVFSLLIECATKIEHPLNAVFLHEFLYKKTLAQRDYLWTTYVNSFTSSDHRVMSLILFLDAGGDFETLSNDSILLLSTTLTWMLSSSNRFIRDKTSKALVEILKNHFDLSVKLIELFEDVNDPYIVQRLYGVLFGACMKRMRSWHEQFDLLAKHVYEHVFCQDLVYPDILLRDYARLIIERYVYEFPQSSTPFELCRIRPPYRSQPVPITEHKEYKNEDKRSGFKLIEWSMSPNYANCGPGLYGDFGRYVFQASLSSFKDVDIPNLYYYALQFIQNELGYTDDLFAEYDTSSLYYPRSRHDVKKIERIGKKYQWIAYYNILARLSDTCVLKADWGGEETAYEGPWEPYVRDFDPTLNIGSMRPAELPCIDNAQVSNDDFIPPESSDEIAKEWSKKICPFFDNHENRLWFSDSNGIQWIALHQHTAVDSKKEMMDRESIGFRAGAQRIWSQSNAFLLNKCDVDQLEKGLKAIHLRQVELPGHSSYALYNREYYWAPSACSIFREEWHELEVPTSKTQTVHIDYPEDENNPLKSILSEYGILPSEYEKVIYSSLCRIKPTYCQYLWEEEFDASQAETTSFDLPCKDILEQLSLSQREHDGFFFDSSGTLVAFDSDLCELHCGLLIRKDYLDAFLNKNGYALFWECLGEKQFFKGSHSQIWTEWEGVYILRNGVIEGKMNPLSEE